MSYATISKKTYKRFAVIAHEFGGNTYGSGQGEASQRQRC
jgi:hypothetical protein